MSDVTQKRAVLVRGYTKAGYALEISLDLVIDADTLARLDERLAAAGISPAPAPSSPANGNGKPKAPKIPPQYDDQGNECCPVHGKALKEGKFGLFCSAKDDGPESRNGYCSYTYKP